MSFNVRVTFAESADDVTFEKVKEFIECNPTKLNEIFVYSGSVNYKGTLLHYSCICNKPKVVSYLLSKHADVTKCYESSGSFYNGLTALEIAKKLSKNSIVDIFNAREESLIAKNQAILEMLYITKSHLPKEMRVLIAQTMNLIWRDQLLQNLMPK